MGRYRMRDVGIRSLLREVKVYVMLPEALWLELRAAAARQGMSMHAAMVAAVRAWVESKANQDWTERHQSSHVMMFDDRGSKLRRSKRPDVRMVNREIDAKLARAIAIAPELIEEHKKAKSMLREEEEPALTPAPEPLNAQAIPNEGWEEGVRERLRDELAGQQVLFPEEEPVREISKRRRK